jgi:hypothetical protein
VKHGEEEGGVEHEYAHNARWHNTHTHMQTHVYIHTHACTHTQIYRYAHIILARNAAQAGGGGGGGGNAAQGGWVEHDYAHSTCRHNTQTHTHTHTHTCIHINRHSHTSYQHGSAESRENLGGGGGVTGLGTRYAHNTRYTDTHGGDHERQACFSAVS